MFVDYIGLPERPVRGLMGYFLSKIKQVMKNIKSIKPPTGIFFHNTCIMKKDM